MVVARHRRRRTAGRSATPCTARVRRERQARACRSSAIYDGKGWIADDFLIGLERSDAFAGPQLVTSALVTVDERRGRRHRCRTPIAAALAGHPDAQVLDQHGFEKEASGFIDQLLVFVTVMLLLAVLIALLGIVNTLALSVFERTRELGLLRAVGMTRGQVRAMVRWESVVISLIGAVDRSGARHRASGWRCPRPSGTRASPAISVPVAADRVVRRAGRRRRRPRRGRSGPVGRQGRRAQGGGDRLTEDRRPAGCLTTPGRLADLDRGADATRAGDDRLDAPRVRALSARDHTRMSHSEG